MPSSNTSQQTTDDGQKPNIAFPSVSVEDTLPPTITTTPTTTSSTPPQDTLNPSPATNIPTSNGSAAPSNDLNISGVVGTTPPKKKFAGGKVIATILGLFLLVGGVGAGVFLTSQNQDIREKAAAEVGGACTKDSDCSSGWVCHCSNGQPCTGGECVNQDYIRDVCTNNGRSWCQNSEYPERHTCCDDGYECGSTPGCFPVGGNGTPIPPGPDCTEAIALYTEQGAMITDLSTLKAGQKVFLTIPIAYGANNTLNFTKARFTVNGTLRPEVSVHKKFQAADVFYDEYTVTSGTTNVQAEVFYDGVWYGK